MQFGRANADVQLRRAAKGVENKKHKSSGTNTYRSGPCNFSHMFIFLLTYERFFLWHFHPMGGFRSEAGTKKQEEDKTTLSKQHRKKAPAHDSLVPKRRRRKNRCVHKESEKSSFSGGLCTSRAVAHKIFGNFSAACVSDQLFSALLKVVGGGVDGSAHTSERPYFHLFYSCFDSEIQENANALYTQSDKMLYKIRHLQYKFTSLLCCLLFYFTSFVVAWSCASQHTPKILSRSLSIAEKILKKFWL